MKIFEALRNLPAKILEPIIKDAVDKRIAMSVKNEAEDRLWRRITEGKWRSRDLSPLSQLKQIKLVDYLHDRNPLAKRMLALTTDFIIGEGITIKADEVKGKEKQQKELQEIIDRFWKNNQWELKQYDRIEELGKYGEQIYRAFVNKFNGDVTLGVFDPEQVNKIETNPQNLEELVKLIPKSGEEEGWEIIRPVKNEDEKITEKTLKGEVFFFPINKGSHATRGKSDLLAVADWVDIYDRTLYTVAERSIFLLTFLWQVILQGAGEKEIEKKTNDLKLDPPKAGSFMVTNELETWKANSPDLKGKDIGNIIKLIGKMPTAGSGIPEHWLFGHGEDVNKASADKMSEPTIRQMERKQKYVTKGMFRTMIDFQIQMKIDKGIFNKKSRVEDYPYTVIAPEPSKEEAGKITEQISQVTPALILAITNKLLTNETATKTLSMLYTQLGVETKAEDEIKKSKEVSESLYSAIDKLMEAAGNKKIEESADFKILKENKVPLTEDERKTCLKEKAVWHFGKDGAESPAVWKSKRSDGSFIFITNTHRAFNTASTLKGAIRRFHDFIKGTA